MIIANYSNCTSGDLRVDNMEPDKASGRLEICDNGVWFSVYRSNSWTSYYSERTRTFACRSLGYGSIGTKLLQCIVSLYCTYIINIKFSHLLVLLGIMYAGATVYRIYYLEQSFRHLYPLDFNCPTTVSASTSFLRDCARNYHSSEYQSSTLYEVGIRCTSRSTGWII